MATKAELEQKVKDLQAVLSAVQDEREDLQDELEAARNLIAVLEVKLEKKEDTLEEMYQEVKALEESLCLVDDGGEAFADREKLLRLMGWTEHEWKLKRDSLNTLLGKKE